MRVMGIDSDGAFGWALYDTDKPLSAIESDSLKLDGEDLMEKLIDLRVRFVPLVKELRPDYAGVEQPSRFLRQFPVNDEGDKGDFISRLERQQRGAQAAPTRWQSESTMSLVVTNQIAGAATVLLLCWNVRCKQIEPRSWQTIIPKSVKAQFATSDPKKKKEAAKKAAKSYCDSLKIMSPNQSSRDACLIAIYTAGHAQELKLMDRARA